jgi:hypothetical protein
LLPAAKGTLSWDFYGKITCAICYVAGDEVQAVKVYLASGTKLWTKEKRKSPEK